MKERTDAINAMFVVVSIEVTISVHLTRYIFFLTPQYFSKSYDLFTNVTTSNNIIRVIILLGAMDCLVQYLTKSNK